MMYRFINFNDEKIDSLLLMELADLTKTLSRDPEFDTDFRVNSYIDHRNKKVYVSHFWTHREEHIMRSGMKSDVYLRAYGNLYYSNVRELYDYANWSEQTKIPRFAKQLCMLAEDVRIEELCKRTRPGMKKDFRVRRDIYENHFENQLKVNTDKNFFLDALFNLTYLLMNSQKPIFQLPEIHDEINPLLPYYRRKIEQLMEANSTQVIAQISKEIVEFLEEVINRDMVNEYFHLFVENPDKISGDYRDLMRKDDLINQDIADEKAAGDEEVHDEEMKTWHRETSSPGKSFLQFDLDQGTQTDILGGEAREGEAGDQALAVVQGAAQKTSNKDFSHLEALEHQHNEKENKGTPFGKENKYAEAIFISNIITSQDQKSEYLTYKNKVNLYQKKLKKAIDLTLEHKKILPRTHLQFGRLDRKLIRIFTDENPRIFYKKNEDSNEIDAVFSLLVDCSASMVDKMEETKRGIVLFHEALKSVKVPHEITGFWEDANDVKEKYQPNYFKRVVDFSSSLHYKTGPEIMSLDAEEDNRDGFAIRVTSKRLLERHEKQKFLIVFSDGEPAAYGYDQNGIVDTHEAVVEARKNGVEVFNVFLSNEEVPEEQRKVFQNIYGAYSLIVPSVEALPDLLFPLLKRLLFRSIQ